MSLPQTMAVGMGDFEGSEEIEPPLTTVRIPARRIGQQAGHHLAISILEDASREVLRSQLSVEMVVRATTRKI